MIFKKFFNENADKVQYFANKFNLSPRISELILSRDVSTDEEFEENFEIEENLELEENIEDAEFEADEVLEAEIIEAETINQE